MIPDAEVIALLRDAVRLWGAAAQVEAGEADIAITSATGEALRIKPGAAPLRWWLTTPHRRRPVASLPALLDAVRSALGVTPATPARVGQGASLPPPLARGGSVRRSNREIPLPPAPPRALDLLRSPHGEAEWLQIPVTLITGFLGSGKTTLVSRLLRDPALARTAVIVNEFGEIGLDHDLIERGDETLLQLTTGCLCCAVQSSIAATLLALGQRRAAGEIGFDRVLVETSGLADPAPILHALMTDAAIGAAYAVGAVVALVDAVHGEATLRRHPEARRQASLADLLLLSKTDLAEPDASLMGALRELNPVAPENANDVSAAALLAPRAAPPLPPRHARHTPGVTAIAIRRDRPVPAAALALFLQSLAAQCGSRLLRLKGLVELAEQPGRPVVVHGVQHVFSPPVRLSAWPAGADGSADRATRLVLIGQNIPRWFPLRLLDAITAEVEDERDSAAGADAERRRPQGIVVRTPSMAAPMSADSDIGRP